MYTAGSYEAMIATMELITPNPSTFSKLSPQSCSLEQTTPPLHRARFYKPPTPGLRSHASRFQPVKTINQNINIMSVEMQDKKANYE